MRIAFISDVHGNEIALEACLRAIQRLQVDVVHFLGDAVGYLPGETAVLEMLREEKISCQQGNHEAMMVSSVPPETGRDRIYRLRPARQRLHGTACWKQILNWPTRVTREFDAMRFLLVHGSPLDHLFGYVYVDSDLGTFGDIAEDAVIMANTHRPWIREEAGRIFVNTGSVGLPRDHGALAAFALYDSVPRKFRIVRVPIDVPAIVSRYGKDVAPEVLECFMRRDERAFGEVLQ